MGRLPDTSSVDCDKKLHSIQSIMGHSGGHWRSVAKSHLQDCQGWGRAFESPRPLHFPCILELDRAFPALDRLVSLRFLPGCERGRLRAPSGEARLALAKLLSARPFRALLNFSQMALTGPSGDGIDNDRAQPAMRGVCLEPGVPQ